MPARVSLFVTCIVDQLFPKVGIAVADVLERLGPYTEVDTVDLETLTRLKDALALVERRATPRERG